MFNKISCKCIVIEDNVLKEIIYLQIFSKYMRKYLPEYEALFNKI